MPRIAPVPPTDVSPEIKAIFDEIEKGFGKVPNLFLTMAHHPPLLKANWEKMKLVMMGGQLPRKLKETMALLISRDNGCQYCVQAHSAALRSLKLNDQTIQLILNHDLVAAGFDQKAIALIRFVQTANQNPHDIPEPVMEELHTAGASNAEIVEALGVMETFIAFNHFLDTLEVEIDF